MNLVQAKALVISPTLRSSDYLKELVKQLPSITSADPNLIKDPRLPSLRTLVVVDNQPSDDKFEQAIKPINAAMDFRDLFVDDPSSHKWIVWEHHTRTWNRDPHEVVNLQFTR